MSQPVFEIRPMGERANNQNMDCSYGFHCSHKAAFYLVRKLEAWTRPRESRLRRCREHAELEAKERGLSMPEEAGL